MLWPILQADPPLASHTYCTASWSLSWREPGSNWAGWRRWCGGCRFLRGPASCRGDCASSEHEADKAQPLAMLCVASEKNNRWLINSPVNYSTNLVIELLNFSIAFKIMWQRRKSPVLVSDQGFFFFSTFWSELWKSWEALDWYTKESATALSSFFSKLKKWAWNLVKKWWEGRGTLLCASPLVISPLPQSESWLL